MQFIYIFNIFFLFTVEANAYIGIGPLLPLLGGAVAYVFFGIILILGFLFYPIKKIYSYFKSKKKHSDIKDNK
tara:strand:+ start:263 stop:481 length:219 start_codon:yes stop_codon:yes gene_type:complete